MAFPCSNLNGLVALLRENGDKILDASSKLSLSASLLYNLNSSLENVWNERQMFNHNFHVFNGNHSELEFVYDFLQKTFALKILPDGAFWNNEKILDIRFFKNLRLLEVQRLSLNLIKGLHTFRHQLKYLICVRSLRRVKEVLEYCGADNSEGFMWNELKEAVFSYNSIDTLDHSLEYAPCLHTLDLSHNHLHNAQLLNCLSNLKHINLSYNQLETVPAFSGELCSHLRILVLCNNFIENIDELAVLINLSELDLSNNCLLEHSGLLPLANLSLLKYLNLVGNPLSFHPCHRMNTAYYLHFNVANQDFMLENKKLNKGERQVIGSVRYVMASTRSHLPSVESFGSENTVMRMQCKNLSIGDTGVSSDMESSTSSLATIKSEMDFEHKENEKKKCRLADCLGMQDSGIGNVNRPMSASQLRSATSIMSNEKEKAAHYESDIEIISNPSQSSIEVICSDLGNIRSESVAIDVVNTLATMDLKKVRDEQHRSL
ncbi:serine/threonine-protein kinase 11-interacting protein-like isoform X2 [Photinus pyralis]|uniref:serine/threonine-protein kinase 11-interacting protein-like isoform X2 n=1 Tax=Photinus pyralis TaxID=7054 RepID=UPI001266F385|nr:serine/threonine-protein kinase 11-interacting protein-like isoform X2 [Photinus pyralis]